MKLLSILSHCSRYGVESLFFFCLLITGCGGGGGGGSIAAPAPEVEWAQVTSRSTSSTTASLAGTAWISSSYYASHCAGLSCLTDTTRTDDYPGVDVACVNLTTGASGQARSYYGPGTDWVHRWSASVPVIPGNNTIRISVLDPGGKGGSLTIEVVAPPPLAVLSITPVSGASGVLPNTAISAQLGGTLSPGPNSIGLSGPNGSVAGTRTVNDSTLTFTPAGNLAYGTTYTVTLPAGLIAVSGASLTADYTWSFTTMAFPVFGVLSTSPAAGDSNVPRNLTVSASFNANLDPTSIRPASFFVTDPTGTRWGYAYSMFGPALSVTDTTLLQARTRYTATLTTGIKDTAGHALPFDYVWSFTTGD